MKENCLTVASLVLFWVDWRRGPETPALPPPFEGLESVKGPLLCGLLGIA